MNSQMQTNWRVRLLSATELLEQTSGAPPWLAQAVRDALPFARVIAPKAETVPQPSPFFYAH